jgi:putative ABC transport system permease protein
MVPLFQDIRYALRGLFRNPLFAIFALAILALGIGTSTAIYGVVNTVLLKPLPYSEPNRLMRVYGAWEQGSREGISPPDFVDYRARTHAFESLASESNYSPLLNISGIERPMQVHGRYVSAGFFKMLGVTPVAGREFQPSEEVWKGPKVAMLSDGLWTSLFGRDRSIVGQSITMNNALYTVVGILPPFFDLGGFSDIYVPMQTNIEPMRGFRSQIVIGRLAPGVEIGQARAELENLASGIEREHLDVDKSWHTIVLPLGNEVVKNARPALLTMLASVCFVVLIVAANLANLMLAQALGRRGELALRIALGSSRWRLARQLLTESFVLSCLGGILGCLVAIGLTGLVRRLGPSSIPRLSLLRVDADVFLFALAVSIGMALFFGAVLVLRFSSISLGEALKQGSRNIGAGLGRMQTGLIVAEIALSLVLLIGAGLLLRSLSQLQQVDPGFRTTNILTTRVALPFAKYNDENKLANFWHEALTNIANLPGVEGEGIVSELPLSGLNNPTPFKAKAPSGLSYSTYVRSVSSDYLKVMDVPLREGRYLTAEDRRDLPKVIVINDVFKHDVFGDSSPIGKTLTFQFDGPPYEATVVGVVGSVHHTSLAVTPFREVYLPLDQSTLVSYSLVVRTAGDPQSLASAVRQAIWSVDRDQSIGPFLTMQQVISDGLVSPRFATFVLASFSIVAMVLSALGLYGVLSYLVSQRTREIGIRMAIGANHSQIMSLIFGKAARLTVLGLLIGGAGAFVVTRFMSGLLFGVKSVDPLTFLVGPLLLAGISFMASYIPARRALLVNPVVALRNE